MLFAHVNSVDDGGDDNGVEKEGLNEREKMKYL